MYEVRDKDDDNIINYNNYCEIYGIEPINECPICGVTISPDILCNVQSNRYVKKNYILACPNCKEIYVEKLAPNAAHFFKRVAIFPKVPKAIYFDDRIVIVSTKFIEIYNQANKAETYDLNEIVGMGYRKALEFLIKDYLKQKFTDQSQNIEKKLLGKCINEYIDNPQIKKMATGATWIGNDETHYIKKWEDKDISDLKKLINLTVQWIVLEIMTKEYQDDMSL